MKSKHLDIESRIRSKAHGPRLAGILSVLLLFGCASKVCAETQDCSPENTKKDLKFSPPATPTQGDREGSTVSSRHCGAQIPSTVQARATVSSLLNLLYFADTSQSRKITVKVPSCTYASVLQELQINHAQFLSPGAPLPQQARAVFNLESETPGLEQTVFFN